ncbi:MAG TPA: lytic murein transglycosylase [Beijerinckiaceae bacterium]|nr:lytic murein transglycosylase [Beijerinckiaceae bacterium]
MTKKLFHLLVVAALATIAVVSFALPATAEQRTFKVRLSDGSIITVTVDAACGAVPSLPGHVVSEVPGACSTPALPTQPAPPVADPTGIVQPGSGSGNGGSGGSGSSSGSKDGGGSSSSGGKTSNGGKSSRGSSGTTSGSSGSNSQGTGQATGQGTGGTSTTKHSAPNAKPPTHHSNGIPTSTNPTFFNALPGPAQINGVPNFVIQKFKVPIFLLPIYQAAGIQYGIRWEVLAGINEIESDYGRNLNVSSAGAVGWMQFMPATWKTYGVDANNDGKRDPYNPVDAIFAAARYLKAAGGDKDIRRAVFAYNHAGWYVDSVMLRARLIAGYPPDFVGSLTGLTEGRFPVAARAKYADDAAARAAQARIKAGQNAARVISSSANRRGIDIFSHKGAAVIATNDGVVKKVGYSKADGHYLVLQDVYGNQYTYSQLGSMQSQYPVPKQDLKPDAQAAKIISARRHSKDPSPKLPASAGSHSLSSAAPSPTAKVPKGQRASAKSATKFESAAPSVTYKARLFAHPQRPGSRESGGLDQVFATQQSGGSKYTTYDNYFAGKVGLNAKNSKLQPLKKGSKIIAGTVIGRIGKTDPVKAPHVYFEIRPAGKGAPQIDPKPILDGWKLLESTAIYRANGKNALYGGSSAFSIGQVLLMPKTLLQKRVLSDPRIQIYSSGRNDIKTGQIDRRVLATLEYLAESGLNPTVTSLKSGHSDRTTSGNISEHSTGDAVDIAKVNGIPIIGHQDKGGIAEQTVRRLMLLQGTMAPHQIISLLDFGANTLAMSDHNDHVHVGFRPLFGDNAKLGAQTAAILKPGQWDNLVHRLNSLPNPVVPTKPSKYALPAKGGSGNGD